MTDRAHLDKGGSARCDTGHERHTDVPCHLIGVSHNIHMYGIWQD